MLSLNSKGVNGAVDRLFSCGNPPLAFVQNCFGARDAEICAEKRFLAKFVLYVSLICGYNFKIDFGSVAQMVEQRPFKP